MTRDVANEVAPDGRQSTERPKGSMSRRGLLMTGTALAASNMTLGIADQSRRGSGRNGNEAQRRVHFGGRLRMEGLRVPWIRHQDAEHRQTCRNGRAARRILCPAKVHTDAGGLHDWTLSISLWAANGGHSIRRKVWSCNRRVAVALSSQAGGIPDRDCGQVASKCNNLGLLRMLEFHAAFSAVSWQLRMDSSRMKITCARNKQISPTSHGINPDGAGMRRVAD